MIGLALAFSPKLSRASAWICMLVAVAASMAVRVWELRGSERCPVIGQIEVASPRWDKITSPETELTSRWCSNSRTFVEPL